MHDRDVSAFIDRIVGEARIPFAHRREELRRELAAHFEDAAADGDALCRFGDPEPLVRSWGLLYRRERVLLYLLKVTLSTVASLGTAMAIAVVSALRSGGFSYRAVPAAIFVLLLVLVREATRPFSASQMMSRLRTYATTIGAAQLLQMFAALVVMEYALHAARGLAFGPGRVMVAASVLATVWAATVTIGSRIDRLFVDRFMTE
jgi:hypothetical protein